MLNNNKSVLNSRNSNKTRNIFKRISSLITVSFSASNYIISGSSGFETAKACAVIEDTPRSNENQISIDDNYDLPVSVKPGKVLSQFDLRLNSKQPIITISLLHGPVMTLKYFQFSII